ncbi:lipoate--protein ligase [Spiroplasma endosymbiont of Labia minor]|uniref:lipoate--protein ligase n=1 Tax=Spiroplasma endosymbiont of Labia minor TaxID=3066305 RepID=UPI0030D0E629
MIEVFISNSNSPYYNLAFEEYLVYSYKTKNQILFLWQNDETIVIGRNQNIHEQINFESVRKNEINIVRRNTGGGTVFQDMGNICFSLIDNIKEDDKILINKTLEPVINFLKKENLNAYFDGKNDIKIDGYKISGSAELKTKDKILVHGTLMYDVDLSKIREYLLLNSTKMESKKIKSNVSVIKNISDFISVKKNSLDFLNDMINFFKTQSEIKIMSNDILKIDQILEQSKNKYQSWDWNYGKSSTFKIIKEKYFPEIGLIQVNLNIKNGKIEDIKFFGDFLGYEGTEKLENSLKNSKYVKEIISKQLGKFDLEKIFAKKITKDNLLDLIF